MSTTSTNFSLVIATTSDSVNVVTQIANNFTTLDSVVGSSLNSTGLKSNLSMTAPTFINPVITGTVKGTRAEFSGTVTCSTLLSGAIRVGTYSFPTTIGSSGYVLAASGNTLTFVPMGTSTGNALGDLSNLSSVNINTSLNNFSAGAVTLNSITATAGVFSGLSTVAMATGSCTTLFVSQTASAATLVATNASVGTLSASAGSINGVSVGVSNAASGTFSGLTVGTYSLPAAIGSSGQLMVASGTNIIFASNSAVPNQMVFEWRGINATGATNCGIYVGTGLPNATQLGNSVILMSYNGNTLRMPFNFYKIAPINTLLCAFYGTGIGDTGALTVLVGTVSGTVTINTVEGWNYAVLNVSTMANNTYHAGLVREEGTNRAYVWSIQVLGTG